MTSKTGKGDMKDVLSEANLRQDEGRKHYILSSLRYWDVGVSHTKKYMVAGHFVPSIRGAALPFMTKKRRITIELYHSAPHDVPVHAKNATQTKKLFGELLKGISSNSLMQVSAMGDHDLDAFRILKLERGHGTHGHSTGEDDSDSDTHSVGSLSSLGFGDADDDMDSDATNIRWKERFRCRLDTVEVSNPQGRSCDLQLGSDGSTILKTIHFECRTDLETFVKVLEQMSQLREQRAKRLASSFKALMMSSKNKPGQSSPTSKISRSGKVNDSAAMDSIAGLITIGDSHDEATIDTAEKNTYLPESGDVENPNDNIVQLLVEIVAAYNLPIADITASDPYVKVYDGDKQVHRTDIIYNSLNPVWTVNTQSLFLIKTSIEDYFTGSNFISFKIKDYDALGKSDTLGTVDVSKDALLQGTGKRQVFEILSEAKGPSKRKAAKDPATLVLRFRMATAQDIIFMEQLAVNKKKNRSAVYAAETFVPPRDHRVSKLKKTSRKGESNICRDLISSETMAD
jgi:C2 domain